MVLVVKKTSANAGNIRYMGLIPGLGRSPGGGHGNPLQYSCLENPMDRGVWWATVYRVTKSQIWLKWLSTHGPIIVWNRALLRPNRVLLEMEFSSPQEHSQKNKLPQFDFSPEPFIPTWGMSLCVVEECWSLPFRGAFILGPASPLLEKTSPKG